MAMVYCRALILTMLTSLEGVRPGTACNEPLSAQTPKACVMRSMLSPIKPMSWSSISPLLTQPFGGYQRTTNTHVVILSLPIKGNIWTYLQLFACISDFKRQCIAAKAVMMQTFKHSPDLRAEKSIEVILKGRKRTTDYISESHSCCLRKRPAIFIFNSG